MDEEILLVNVKRINSRDEKTGFTIFTGKILNKKTKKRNNQYIFRGIISSIYEEDEFNINADLVDDDKRGEYYRIKSVEKIKSQSIKGVKTFFKKRIKGIGDKTASLIVDTLGIEAISKIENDWKCLLDIPGLSKKKILQIKEVLESEKKFEKLLLFVQNNNFNYKIAMAIYEDFKDESITKIQENPYCITGIEKIGFQIADKFAKNMNFSPTNDERIKKGIIYFIQWHSKYRGDLFVFKDYLISSLDSFLKIKGSFGKDYLITEIDIEKNLKELINSGTINVESYLKDKNIKTVKQRFCLYLAEFNYIENEIVRMVKELINSKCTFDVDRLDISQSIDSYERETGITLANKQKTAIYTALCNRLSILTGGPGTGKTQTINAIIKCIKKLKPDAIINLTAPTGRASKRMEELTHMNALTIHRLIRLGVSSQIKEQEIVGDYVIIDESSMIDAFVFFKLLQNISDDTNVIFVGDYEQLPSVGPGLILRDLIRSNVIKTTILDEIFRQAQSSLIVSNSHKIIKGITTKTGLEFNDLKKDDFYFFRENRIFALKKLLIEKKYFNLKDIQILSPMKVGDLGTRDLNSLIQEEFNPHNEKYYELEMEDGKLFRVGDRVIQTANNYDLDIFNGDIGYIKSISNPILDDMEVIVEFMDRTVVYDKKSVDELELAYAITIHKSQGSEFPVVLMPIADIHKEMLDKNLIYTGWTRAKRMVVLFGDYRVLDRSIEKVNEVNRNSQILYKLIA